MHADGDKRVIDSFNINVIKWNCRRSISTRVGHCRTFRYGITRPEWTFTLLLQIQLFFTSFGMKPYECLGFYFLLVVATFNKMPPALSHACLNKLELVSSEF